MLGILWFFFWQALGAAVAFRIFYDKRPLVRLWLGSVTGSVLSMWTPIPFAFAWGFSLRAHAAAAILADRAGVAGDDKAFAFHGRPARGVEQPREAARSQGARDGRTSHASFRRDLA